MTAEDSEFAQWERTFNELDERAAALKDAGGAEFGSTLVDLADHVYGLVPDEDVVELLLQAREVYLTTDPEAAARCAFTIGLLAHDSGDAVLAQDAFAVARDSAVDLGDRELQAEAANNFGTAAIVTGDYQAAEIALEESTALYRDLGLDAEATDARFNLASVYRLTGQRDRAEYEFKALWLTYPAGSSEAGKCAASLGGLYMESERYEEATKEFARAAEVFTAIGAEVDALECEVGAASVRMMLGELGPAISSLKHARQQFHDIGRPDRTAVCDYSLALCFTLRSEFRAADEAFEAARVGLVRTEQHHHLANLMWNRAKRFLTEAAADASRRDALSSEGVDTMVASLFAIDSQRFQFRDSIRRIQWAETYAERLATTFTIAYRLGLHDVLIDLVESGINSGVYGIDGDTDAAPDDRSLVGLDDGDGAMAPNAVPGSEDVATNLGTATLLATALLPLAPPPALLVPSTGTIVQDRQRRIAAAVDPYLREMLEALPAVALW